MVAISETHQSIDGDAEYNQSRALRAKLKQSSGVNRGGRVFLGSVLTISALGLWLIPVAHGDAAMQLMKLLVSLLMVGTGMMFILSVDRGAELPEIQIDTQKRELRVLKLDDACNSYVAKTHKLDDLAEVTVKDKLLTARDASGNIAVSVPIRDRTAEREVRAALEGVI